MDLVTIGLIAAGVVGGVIVLKMAGRLAGSLFYDYVVDGLLSILDTFIGGLVGFDIGDWIAAVLIFNRLRKRTSLFWAFIGAWEAANFFPVSLIPGLNIAIGAITNLFPAVTLIEMFFGNDKQAQAMLRKLESKIQLGKDHEINVADDEAAVDKVRRLIAELKHNEALAEANRCNGPLSGKLIQYINDAMARMNAFFNELVGASAGYSEQKKAELQELMQGCYEHMENAKYYVEQDDFENAFAEIAAAEESIEQYKAKVETEETKEAEPDKETKELGEFDFAKIALALVVLYVAAIYILYAFGIIKTSPVVWWPGVVLIIVLAFILNQFANKNK